MTNDSCLDLLSGGWFLATYEQFSFCVIKWSVLNSPQVINVCLPTICFTWGWSRKFLTSDCFHLSIILLIISCYSFVHFTNFVYSFCIVSYLCYLNLETEFVFAFGLFYFQPALLHVMFFFSLAVVFCIIVKYHSFRFHALMSELLNAQSNGVISTPDPTMAVKSPK